MWAQFPRLMVMAAVFASGCAYAGEDEVADRVERVLALRADRDHGRVLYAQHCAFCHGINAWGEVQMDVPALAGQRPNYLLQQLAEVIEGDRSLPEMHRLMARWETEDPQALRDLVTHLADRAPNPKPQRGTGVRLAEGERLYQSDCAECHGRFGDGDNPGFIPALRGQHYGYLTRQMQAFATGHRAGMDRMSWDRLASLKTAQLEAIADYISRLPSERDAVPDGNPFVPGADSR